MASLDPKDPFGPGIRIQEAHKKEIYCLDWSADLFLAQDPNCNDILRSKLKTKSKRNDSKDERFADGMELMDTDEEDEENGNGLQRGASAETETFRVLASCASRYVNLYQVPVGPNHSNEHLQMIQSYMDCDPKEQFFACAFAGRCIALGEDEESPAPDNHKKSTSRDSESHRPAKLLRTNDESNAHGKGSSDLWPFTGETGTGPQMLCVAGGKCTIKVIDTLRQHLAATLVAHGDEIYDLKVCPTDEFILCSASKDNTIRIWNLKLGAQVAVLCGHEGHLDDVVSVGWHASGDLIASGSMDATIKIWDLSEGTLPHKSIRKSHKAAGLLYEKGVLHNDRVLVHQIPLFNADSVHFYCVDSVSFLGDCVLSRSQEDVIVCWEPVISEDVFLGSSQMELPHPVSNQVRHLRSFSMRESQYWFIRFAVDRAGKTLACGNIRGEISVWRVRDEPKTPFKMLGGSKIDSAVRAISFSPDDDIMVAATDKGEIWKWDVRREKAFPG